MKMTTYKQGMPSWVELSTTDEAAAIAFYGALFGWTDEPNDTGDGTMYHMQRLGDDYVAAITQQRPDEAQQGIPSHWMTYITVDDVDAVAGRVAAAGGQVVAPPFDVLDSGRMAVIIDATGAFVSLWQPKQHPGAGVMNEPNAFTWAELITSDPEKAAAFYEALLGVATMQAPGSGSEPYTMLTIDGEPVAGILNMTPEMRAGGMPPNWFTYFQVTDVDAAMKRVTSLGGQSLMPVMEIPAMRFAVVNDPQGAAFGLMQPTGSPGT
jgi:predicted enzyme related to lactoylglutathione lyase